MSLSEPGTLAEEEDLECNIVKELSYESSEENQECPVPSKRWKDYSTSQVSCNVLEDNSGRDLFQHEDDEGTEALGESYKCCRREGQPKFLLEDLCGETPLNNRCL